MAYVSSAEVFFDETLSNHMKTAVITTIVNIWFNQHVVIFY